MARARNIKPGFFLNEELAEISPEGRLLFIGLWMLADREGRLEDRPKKIKAEIFPYENYDVDSLLNDLESKNFIKRYCIAEKRYVQVITFTRHQNPHPREAKSIIPPCEEIAENVDITESREKVLPSREKVLPSRADTPFSESPLSSSSESMTKDEQDVSAAVAIYEEVIGKPIHGENEKDLLLKLLDTYGIANVKYAMNEAIKHDARNLAYIEKILENRRRGIKKPGSCQIDYPIQQGDDDFGLPETFGHTG